MIQIEKSQSGSRVTVNGKEIEVFKRRPDYVIAHCTLDTLRGVLSSEPFPEGLGIDIIGIDELRVFPFNQAGLASIYNWGLYLDFYCHLPKKYFKRPWHMITFLGAIADQVHKSNCFEVKHWDNGADWKHLVVGRSLSSIPNETLHHQILDGASELKKLIHAADKALFGTQSKGKPFVCRDSD